MGFGRTGSGVRKKLTRRRPEETERGALLNNCIDAWRYLKPGDPDYTYDGIASACARPDTRIRPGRIFCNAELRGTPRGAKLAVATK